ncbi:ATP-binding cassette domain-containing protein [Agromyces sp. C10]|uniref:ATP-binding cassette domain-containing protein n=1 Tax=Agromyces sp. C10 TaxID=2935077 RepID=UPI0035B10533
MARAGQPFYSKSGRLSLDLPSGDRVAVLGSNQPGKSTLLDVLTDETKVGAGAVRWATGGRFVSHNRV